jgi:hypothetical protein
MAIGHFEYKHLSINTCRKKELSLTATQKKKHKHPLQNK